MSSRNAKTQPAAVSPKRTEMRDLDHYDALSTIRDRICGLRCAIGGAHFASKSDRSGLLRLVEDLTESMACLCRQHARDHNISAPMTSEAAFPTESA